jgi:transcriptional regulator with XRE-family HTH domain
MATSDSLRELAAKLESADSRDDAAFSSLLNQSAAALQLSDLEISKMFDVSRPTVNRWKNGRATPYPPIRRLIYRDLGNLAKQRAKTVKAAERRSDSKPSSARPSSKRTKNLAPAV